MPREARTTAPDSTAFLSKQAITVQSGKCDARARIVPRARKFNLV